MSVKIGIPRALFYYRYYPLWKVFFEYLGAETVLSGKTSARIVDEGVKTCVDEACLPVKVCHGHVKSLVGKADLILVPRFTSISKGEYVCPKLGGIPDMIRHSISPPPPLIAPEVNLRRSKRDGFCAALEAGRFITCDAGKIRRAYGRAIEMQKDYMEKIKAGALPEHLLDEMEREGRLPEGVCRGGPYHMTDHMKVVLIGHVYNIHDRHINMDIISKLEKYGINIMTLDMLDDCRLQCGNPAPCANRVFSKKMFWYFGNRAINGIEYVTRTCRADGILYLTSFGCGVDSFTCDMAKRTAVRNGGIPFMTMTLDEHSGEAGFDTRIEAFADMLRWNRRLRQTGGPANRGEGAL